MQIDLVFRSKTPPEHVKHVMRARLRRALGRQARRIEGASVTFDYVSGDSAQMLVQCRMRLLLRPRGSIYVSALAPLHGAALASAAQRANKCVRALLRRRWLARRRRTVAAQRRLQASGSQDWRGAKQRASARIFPAPGIA